MTDKIIIQELALHCHIGMTADERANKQVILVTMELCKDLRQAGVHDDIAQTVNYSEVCKHVVAVTAKEYYTLEALAEAIAVLVKKEFTVEKVRVLVKKPGALAKYGAAYAAVEIER